jgi:DNA repair protein RecO (recombination protein O)
MRSYTTEGIIIKRSDFGEADRLITIFTQNHGKITVLAKGVRKPTSKRSSSLELFNHLRVHIIKGRGELDTLGEVQLIESFPHWRKHLGRVNIAYQLAEAVDKLTPDHQPHPQIFKILQQSLLEIGKLKIDWKLKIKNWLIEIASELGYWPKNKAFDGDVYEFLERIISRPLHSPKLLQKLK